MHKSGKYFDKYLKKIFFSFVLFQSCLVFPQSGLDSLETLYNHANCDSLKIVYGIQLSREMHREKYGEEQEYAFAQKAVKRALKLNDTLLYAKALDNFGLLYRFHQHYGESLDLHAEAFELVENKAIKPVYKMIFANNAGVAARYNEKYDVAVSYYVKALNIAEKQHNLRNIAISNNGIGNALGNIPNRKNEALGYFKRSLKAERKRNNSLGVAMNYLSISGYYIDKEKYSIARDYLDKLFHLNQKRKDKYGLAITYEFKGTSYLKEGKNLAKAHFYFKEALSRFKSLNDEEKQAEILIKLGDVNLNQDQLDRAGDYYRESLALAEKLNQNELIKENAFKLSRLLEEKNQPSQALQYYKQGKAYEDSIKLTEQNVKIEALTRKYNLKKKEGHIKLLEKDKTLQKTKLDKKNEQLEHRRSIIILLIIGALSILIIFGLQYRNYRNRKKTNAELQKQEKEKMNAIYERNLAKAEILVTRLRINPHFLFNCLNAISYLIQSEQNKKATKYLGVFSRYTRMVLETSKQQVVPLSEEIKLARYYLTLEENRFEKGFKYDIKHNDQEINGVFIPPLLLQPFIENAIWHGLLPSKRENKTLLIKTTPIPEGLEIIIDDNGVGRKISEKRQTTKNRKSMGVQIIKERIELYNKSYSEKIDYKIIDKKNKDGKPVGTQVVLTLTQSRDDKIQRPNLDGLQS